MSEGTWLVRYSTHHAGMTSERTARTTNSDDISRGLPRSARILMVVPDTPFGRQVLRAWLLGRVMGRCDLLRMEVYRRIQSAPPRESYEVELRWLVRLWALRATSHALRRSLYHGPRASPLANPSERTEQERTLADGSISED